jgi:hypothetical protein
MEFLGTLANLSDPTDVAPIIESSWFRRDHMQQGFSHLYDVTVLQKAALPIVFRDAHPSARPFGRDIGSLHCRCLVEPQWKDARYEIGGKYVVHCQRCRQRFEVPTPEGTKLNGRHGRWYVKIIQFYVVNTT